MKMDNGVTKYKSVHIIKVNTPKYPHMVQIISTPKKCKELLGKKYIDIKHCITSIDRVDTERLIEDNHIKSHKEMSNFIVQLDDD